MPFPGLNIDNLASSSRSFAGTAHGKTIIHDWVYENRAIYLT
jgi:UDP-N-acetylglucosamine 1-carboxyvinyltransferase